MSDRLTYNLDEAFCLLAHGLVSITARRDPEFARRFWSAQAILAARSARVTTRALLGLAEGLVRYEEQNGALGGLWHADALEIARDLVHGLAFLDMVIWEAQPGHLLAEFPDMTIGDAVAGHCLPANGARPLAHTLLDANITSCGGELGLLTPERRFAPFSYTELRDREHLPRGLRFVVGLVAARERAPVHIAQETPILATVGAAHAAAG